MSIELQATGSPPRSAGKVSNDAAGLLAEEEGWTRDDADEVKTNEEDTAAAASPPRSRLASPWLPDAPQRCGGSAVKSLKARVRLAKFLVLSWVLIVCGHAFIRAHNSERKWERDPNYSIDDFHSLDLHSCALDALCYFIVGRWWKRKGVDRWNVFAPMVLGLILFSAVGAADIAHYSISLFAIKCLWPPAVVVAAAVLCIAVIVIVCLHVRAAWRDGILLGRCIEIAATALIFVLPVFRDPSFHLHHWYWTWLIGMHANQDAWWSQAASAFLWGGYLNGIAAYGRDDLLGCKRSFYAGANQHCGYLDCYYESHYTSQNATIPAKPPFVDAPDWRTCEGMAP